MSQTVRKLFEVEATYERAVLKVEWGFMISVGSYIVLTMTTAIRDANNVGFVVGDEASWISPLVMAAIQSLMAAMVINVVKSYWGDSYVVEGRAGSILVGNDGVGKVRNVVAAGYFVNAAVGIGVYVVWDLAVTLSGGGEAGSSGSGGGGGAGGWCWCLTSMVVLITLAAVPLAEHQISVARFYLVVLALPRQQRALLVGIVTVLAFFARLVLCAGAVIVCLGLSFGLVFPLMSLSRCAPDDNVLLAGGLWKGPLWGLETLALTPIRFVADWSVPWTDPVSPARIYLLATLAIDVVVSLAASAIAAESTRDAVNPLDLALLDGSNGEGGSGSDDGEGAGGARGGSSHSSGCGGTDTEAEQPAASSSRRRPVQSREAFADHVLVATAPTDPATNLTDFLFVTAPHVDKVRLSIVGDILAAAGLRTLGDVAASGNDRGEAALEALDLTVGLKRRIQAGVARLDR